MEKIEKEITFGAIPKKTILLVTLLALLTILFFVGGPSYHSPRSFKAFWNLGHILYFALLPLAGLPYFKKKQVSLSIQLLTIISVTLLLGIAIELIQGNGTRTPDAGDLFRDVIGAMVCVAFLLPAMRTIPRWGQRLLKATAIVLVLSQVFPIAFALTDEYRARAQFPVLADFESPFEGHRWKGNAAFVIDDTIAFAGRASLRVMLTTDLYSGVGLHYFPGNWQAYKRLQLHVFNPLPDPLRLTCRIHDRIHTQGVQSYQDRFNQHYSLNQGWNLIDIDLAQVKTAPASRQMDMGHIDGFGIFATGLSHPRPIFIDNVHLKR